MKAEAFVITNQETLNHAHKYLDERFELKSFMVIEIKDAKNRSLSQNNLFHLWCSTFARELTSLGRKTNSDETKAWFKHKFLGYEDFEWVTGEHKISGQLKQTSSLNAGEMFFFMQECWDWCAETYGIFLPLPEESEFYQIKKRQSE